MPNNQDQINYIEQKLIPYYELIIELFNKIIKTMDLLEEPYDIDDINKLLIKYTQKFNFYQNIITQLENNK